jgi:hypothetical protein
MSSELHAAVIFTTGENCPLYLLHTALGDVPDALMLRLSNQMQRTIDM